MNGVTVLAFVGLLGVDVWGPQLAGEQQKCTRGNPQEQITGPDLLPLEASTSTFKVTDQSPQRQQISSSLQRTDQYGAEWVLTTGNTRRMFLRREGDGTTLLTSLELRDEGRRVEYEPPVVLISAAIEPGQRKTMTSSVTVYDLEDGSKIGSGSATHSWRERGWSELSLPIGTRRAFMIEMNQKLDLDLASVDSTLLTGYEPGVGRVYQWMRTSTEKLGLFGETTVQEIQIASENQPE